LLNPYNNEIQTQLIELQYFLKKDKELIETFSKLVLEDSDFKLYVGLAYLELSEPEKANLFLKSYFDKSRSSQDPLYFYTMGKIQLSKGYKKEANLYFDKFLNLAKTALSKTDNSLDKYRLEEKQSEVKKIFDSK
jgi:tetratricopeptide (TPR) repeat protein